MHIRTCTILLLAHMYMHRSLQKKLLVVYFSVMSLSFKFYIDLIFRCGDICKIELCNFFASTVFLDFIISLFYCSVLVLSFNVFYVSVCHDKEDLYLHNEVRLTPDECPWRLNCQEGGYNSGLINTS